MKMSSVGFYIKVLSKFRMNFAKRFWRKNIKILVLLIRESYALIPKSFALFIREDFALIREKYFFSLRK